MSRDREIYEQASESFSSKLKNFQTSDQHQTFALDVMVVALYEVAGQLADLNENVKILVGERLK